MSINRKLQQISKKKDWCGRSMVQIANYFIKSQEHTQIYLQLKNHYFHWEKKEANITSLDKKLSKEKCKIKAIELYEKQKQKNNLMF